MKRRPSGKAPQPSDLVGGAPTPGIPTPSEELRRYRAGEISEAEYVQARIDHAMTHLRGRVSKRKIARIRQMVADACASDPVLKTMKARLLRASKR